MLNTSFRSAFEVIIICIQTAPYFYKNNFFPDYHSPKLLTLHSYLLTLLGIPLWLRSIQCLANRIQTPSLAKGSVSGLYSSFRCKGLSGRAVAPRVALPDPSSPKQLNLRGTWPSP